MAARHCNLLLVNSTARRLERYAKLHGIRFEEAAVRAIENWLEDAGELQTRIKEAQRAHRAALAAQGSAE